MINDIRHKLQDELNKRIEGEPQVIYILSRVRKILEIGGKEKEKEYDKLKFYCDWALHAKINNVGAVRETLDEIIAGRGDVGADLAMQFGTLHTELKRFLKENNLTTTIYDSDEDRFHFEKYLSLIYADTPLIVDGNIELTWLAQAGEKSFGGSFKAKSIDQ